MSPHWQHPMWRALAALLAALGVLIGISVHADAAPPHRVVVSVAVANIRSRPAMDAAASRHDLAALVATGAQVLMGAEISHPDQKQAWRELAGRSRRTVGLARTDVPTSIPTAWPATRSGVATLGLGRGRVCPPRHAVVTLTRIDGLPVAFVSTHLVPTSSRWPVWRAREYVREVTRLATIVGLLHDGGDTVIVGGDLNSQQVITYARGQVTAHHGAMQIAVIPALGVAVHLGRVQVVPRSRLYTDHPILSASITLTKE